MSGRPAEQAGSIAHAGAAPSAQALLAAGRRHRLAGDGPAALAAFRAAVAAAPDDADGWRALGDQLHCAGEEAGGDAAHRAALVAGIADAGLRAGADALVSGDLPQAQARLRARLTARPTDTTALRLLAELAARSGRHQDAAALLRRLLSLADGDEARHALALALYRQGLAEQAIAELDALLAGDPGHPAYLSLKAAALGAIGAQHAAVALYHDVLGRFPHQPGLWLRLGHALKTIGRQAEAIAAYRRALALQPTLGEAWWSLANLKTVRFTAADRAAMHAAAARADLGPEDRLHVQFALGKAEEDERDWAASFGHYAEGNRLRRAMISYDPARATQAVDQRIALMTQDFFAERADWGCPAADPIFIVSLPRSGSTLIEQILASHAQVEGTTELNDIAILAARVGQRGGAIDRETAHALGQEYLDRTRIQRQAGTARFIDKMPNNWAHVGLIRLILPNATIIDARRDPLACCFGNFKQHFARGQAFSYDLADLGHYYRDYARMMAHWDAVLPGFVHRVSYEAMVDDIEAEIRALLAHGGLPFEPACLRFHETERAVRTASSEQVRRPIFRDGLQQWRHYEPWLGPLKQALGIAG